MTGPSIWTLKIPLTKRWKAPLRLLNGLLFYQNRWIAKWDLDGKIELSFSFPSMLSDCLMLKCPYHLQFAVVPRSKCTNSPLINSSDFFYTCRYMYSPGRHIRFLDAILIKIKRREISSRNSKASALSNFVGHFFNLFFLLLILALLEKIWSNQRKNFQFEWRKLINNQMLNGCLQFAELIYKEKLKDKIKYVHNWVHMWIYELCTSLNKMHLNVKFLASNSIHFALCFWLLFFLPFRLNFCIWMRIITLNARAWNEKIYQIQTDLKVFMNNIHWNKWWKEKRKNSWIKSSNKETTMFAISKEWKRNKIFGAHTLRWIAF